MGNGMNPEGTIAERYAVPVERALHGAEIVEEMEVLKACASYFDIDDSHSEDGASAFDTFLIAILPSVGEKLKSLIADPQYNAEMLRFAHDMSVSEEQCTEKPVMPKYLESLFIEDMTHSRMLH